MHIAFDFDGTLAEVLREFVFQGYSKVPSVNKRNTASLVIKVTGYTSVPTQL